MSRRRATGRMKGDVLGRRYRVNKGSGVRRRGMDDDFGSCNECVW